MSTKKIIVFIIVTLVTILVMRTFFQSEEDRIRKIIFQAKRAIEKESLLKCIVYISFDYEDSYGNDRRNLILITKRIFEVYNKLSIRLKDIDISAGDTSAEAEFSVVIFGVRAEEGKKEEIFERDEDKLKVFFRKEENGWKVIKIESLEKRKYLY